MFLQFHFNLFQNTDTHNEVKMLLQIKDYNGLALRLKTRMEFGTAGLLLLTIHFMIL